MRPVLVLSMALSLLACHQDPTANNTPADLASNRDAASNDLDTNDLDARDLALTDTPGSDAAIVDLVGVVVDVVVAVDVDASPEPTTLADLHGPADLAPTAAPDLAPTLAPDLAPPTLLTETFATTPAASWPSPFTILGGTAIADVVSGRGRLRPTLTQYSLARVGAPLATVDADATYTIRFANPATSGIGFYLRSNGGHLRTTTTHGQGYAVFVEGFRGNFVGLWYEQDGVETEIQHVTIPTLVANTDYRVRFAVEQLDATHTQLRAKFWLATSPEPTAWSISSTRMDTHLQNVAGGVAIDCWSTRIIGQPAADDCFVDDLTILEIP